MAIAEVSRINAQPTRHAEPAPVQTASVALVPVTTAPQRLQPLAYCLTRPDPSFVTHLIAMADLNPQTRMLRRAEPQDVQAAYRSVANQNQKMTPPGVRMRHSA